MNYKKGMKLRRNNLDLYNWWNEGKIYTIEADEGIGLFVTADDDSKYYLKTWGEEYFNERFQVISDSEPVEKVEDYYIKLVEGMKLRLLSDGDNRFTVGKDYEVKRSLMGNLYINSDNEVQWFEREINSILPDSDIYFKSVSPKLNFAAGDVVQIVDASNLHEFTQDNKYTVHDVVIRNYSSLGMESDVMMVVYSDLGNKFQLFESRFIKVAQESVEENITEPVQKKYRFSIETDDLGEFTERLRDVYETAHHACMATNDLYKASVELFNELGYDKDER